jgi:hypothetical protein
MACPSSSTPFRPWPIMRGRALRKFVTRTMPLAARVAPPSSRHPRLLLRFPLARRLLPRRGSLERPRGPLAISPLECPQCPGRPCLVSLPLRHRPRRCLAPRVRRRLAPTPPPHSAALRPCSPLVSRPPRHPFLARPPPLVVAAVPLAPTPPLPPLGSLVLPRILQLLANRMRPPLAPHRALDLRRNPLAQISTAPPLPPPLKVSLDNPVALLPVPPWALVASVHLADSPSFRAAPRSPLAPRPRPLANNHNSSSRCSPKVPHLAPQPLYRRLLAQVLRLRRRRGYFQSRLHLGPQSPPCLDQPLPAR